MKIKKYLIAGGNSTLLISGCPFIARDKTSKKYISEVEQVGFVEEEKGIPKLIMMGDELCINGTLALAYSASSSGKLKTSGIKERVSYSNFSEKTSISFNLDYYIEKNIIIFEGIGFIYEKKLPEKEKIMQILKDLCGKFSLPAFGLISLKKDVLIPYIYVQKINSLVKETACGSGSIAINILKEEENILQPTGQIIKVSRNKNRFTVSANVATIK